MRRKLIRVNVALVTTLHAQYPPCPADDGRMCCCKPGAHRTMQSSHMGGETELAQSGVPTGSL